MKIIKSFSLNNPLYCIIEYGIIYMSKTFQRGKNVEKSCFHYYRCIISFFSCLWQESEKMKYDAVVAQLEAKETELASKVSELNAKKAELDAKVAELNQKS